MIYPRNYIIPPEAFPKRLYGLLCWVGFDQYCLCWKIGYSCHNPGSRCLGCCFPGSHRLDRRDKPASSSDGYPNEELDPTLGRLVILFQLSCVILRL